MSTLKRVVRRSALRLGRFDLFRRRLRSIDNLHALLHRQFIFETLGIDLVLDVGANKGQFGTELRDFYRGEVISFEPVTEAFAELAKISRGDPGWKIQQFALGSENGVQEINVGRHSQLSSFLKANEYCRHHFGEVPSATNRETVNVRKLDDCIEKIVPNFKERKMFLKLDTQGYDVEVLKGFGKNLRHVIALQCEVSVIPIYEGMPHWTETVSFLERSGFGIAGLLPISFDGLRAIELDCLMVKTPDGGAEKAE